MRIAVFGLGYVGTVSAACLSDDGHQVVGVDPNSEKVDLINSGKAPVMEPGLDALIGANVENGRLSAVTDPAIAIASSEVALICVGTPSRPDGALDLRFVEAVSREIGRALRESDSFYSVILRSTVLPGTTRNLVIPTIEEESGRRFPQDFSVSFNPEFLREGTSLSDYYHPPRVVTGTESGKPNEFVQELYSGIEGERFATEFEIAELAKYVDNTWHALKVVFANEIGRISHAIGVDGRSVMEIMMSDRKLNISTKYLRPGFAYGGSCLPKDVSALAHFGAARGVDLPMIDSIPSSNQVHIRAAFDVIAALDHRKVGLLGLTFKPGTDDIRNSPFVSLFNQLRDAGFEVAAADPLLELSNLTGSNLEFLHSQVPGIDELLFDRPEQLVEWADVLVVGKNEPGLTDCLQATRGDQYVVDLAGLSEPIRGSYIGLVW